MTHKEKTNQDRRDTDPTDSRKAAHGELHRVRSRCQRHHGHRHQLRR